MQARLDALASGAESPESVEGWAMEYLLFDDPQIYPEVTDATVWEALLLMSGAGGLTGPSTYLHGSDDFQAWAEAFREKCKGA